MSLGIFVEGESDAKAIPILLHKVGQSRVHVRVVSQGRLLNVEAMARHISALRQTQRGIKRVLIFRDSECTDPEITRQGTEEPERELNRRFRRLPIRYVIVDHSIEGWLLCDPDAVRAALGSQARGSIPPNPEESCRPAQLLERFRKNGRPLFNKVTHNPQIAEKARPEVIAQRSPTFRQFLETLRQV